MEKKLIINVGRQLGSGGSLVAKALANEFNCQFYDKEILNLAAKESGSQKSSLRKTTNRRDFLKSHFQINLPIFSNNDFYKNNFSQEGLYQFQCDVIRKAAEENNRCVFVGRTADYVLRENPNTINVS